MKMVKNEWRFIRHNRLILLSVIVMTIIPLLYSVFFLKSVWDPYGDTQNLPVAVVNKDKPVDYNGETLNVGKETVNNLKNNDQLGWRFVSEKQAKHGLSNQKYYTVITLPKNFSKNATTVLDKKPKKMKLSYKTNGSLNYIGEVISQMGASTLDKQIRAAVTNAYASAIFDQLHVVGKGMKTASSGATQLDKGIVTLNDGLGQYTVAVSQVNDGVQTLKTSVKPLAGGVSQLATGGNQLVSGVNTYTGGVSQLAAGIATLNQSVGPLASGVNQLANGGNQLVAKSGELNSGAQQVAGGLGTLQSNVGPLANGVNKLATGSKQLQSGVSAYTSGTKSARAGSSQLADGLKQLDTGSQAVADGILKVNQGVSSQDSQLTELNKGLGQMKDGLTELNKQVNSDEVSQAISKLQEQVAGLDGATTAATTSLTKIKENTQTTATAAGSLKEQISASDLETAQKAKLLAEVQKIGTAQASNGTELQNVQTALAPLKEINVDQLKALSAKIQSLQGAINKLYAGYVTGANGQTSLYNGGLAAINGLRSVQENTAKDSDLYRGATDVSNGIASASTGANQLDSGLGELTANSGALNSGAATLSGGIGTMNGQIPTLTNGVNQLSTGSKQLASGVQQYTGGTGQVANGLNQMNSQVPTLVSGVGQLYTGSQTLNANSGALNDGAGQLANGLNQMNSQVPTLTSGVSQLADGTSQLDAKSEDLTDGGGKLSKGSGTLANALGDGSKKVNGIHTTDKTANMFAKPTKLKHHKYSYVSNYGHALAPYVLSVALYVGALVFNFAYPIRKISTRGQSATAWFFSKASVGGVVAIMMAVIEASLMMLFGLNVDHVGSFYLIAIIFALASMFIVMMLSMAFDNPGRFVAMVLLMLQLGGSGGTFPMEVTNSFYNVIHAYLPMTYSILGFRQAITSGLGSGQIWSSFFTLAGVVVVSLLLLWWVMKILQQIHLNGVSQLDDNQKLQDLEQ